MIRCLKSAKEPQLLSKTCHPVTHMSVHWGMFSLWLFIQNSSVSVVTKLDTVVLRQAKIVFSGICHSMATNNGSLTLVEHLMCTPNFGSSSNNIGKAK